ncbi:hypothetical protein pb186bvf_004759 [Paramecium bursaria]
MILAGKVLLTLGTMQFLAEQTSLLQNLNQIMIAFQIIICFNKSIRQNQKLKKQYFYSEIKVCQKYQHQTIYWKIKHYVRFMKRQKTQQKNIALQRQLNIIGDSKWSSSSIIVQQIYKSLFQKEEVFKKCLNRKYEKHTVFTKDFQIILKCSPEQLKIYLLKGPNPPFHLYNFFTKSFTICNVESSCDNTYEYCPINDVILIPSLKKNYQRNKCLKVYI